MNQEEPYGWFCPTAARYIANYDQYEDFDPNAKDFGFSKSWHDWFTRQYKP